MSKSPTNVYTYLMILFIFLLLSTGLIYVGRELILNENNNLDDDSIEYIANINGIDLDAFEVTDTQIETSILFSDNTSQGNPKDYSLEFQFAKERGLPVENTIKQIYSVPGTIIFTFLNLNKNSWLWIVNILNWFWRLAILLALIYLARGIIS